MFECAFVDTAIRRIVSDSLATQAWASGVPVSDLTIDGGKEKRSSGSTWLCAFARADPVIDRRAFIASMLGCLLALPIAANAQQEAKIRLIGILTNSMPLPTSPFWETFRQTLGERGFIEGQNIRFEGGSRSSSSTGTQRWPRISCASIAMSSL
jgi:hypothetical protein